MIAIVVGFGILKETAYNITATKMLAKYSDPAANILRLSIPPFSVKFNLYKILSFTGMRAEVLE
jgi:hypothetical protein